MVIPGLLDKLAALPPDKQQRVLDFVESLQAAPPPAQPKRSIKGLCADLGVDISEEDIAQMRREAWRHFPRDFTDEEES